MGCIPTSPACGKQIGFNFPSPYLLPFLSVRDNVALLAMVLGRSNQEACWLMSPPPPSTALGRWR